MTEIIEPGRVRFGPYEVDLHTHELWKHGTRVKLVGQPFEILAVLVRRPGQLVTREQLRAELWPEDTFVDFNHGLNAAVNKLRDALCDSADDPKYIETLPRRGYRFKAPVEKVSRDQARSSTMLSESGSSTVTGEPVAVLPLTTQSAGAGTTPAVDGATRRPRRRWRWLILAGALLFFGISLLSSVDVREMIRSFHGQLAKREAEKPGLRPPALLTSLSDPASDPAFSPDGNRVAFRRTGFVPGTSGIWVKKVDGDELLQITSGVNDCCPTWAPDGKTIAFSRYGDSDRTIYTVPSVGGTPRKLFSAPMRKRQGELDWSPDGKTIALVGEVGPEVSAIFVLGVEDGTARQLTMPVAQDRDWGAAFSPDGSKLVFVRTRNARSSLMIVPSQGGEALRVPTDPHEVDGSAVWTADSSALVFTSRQDDSDSLWRVPVDRGVPTPIVEAGSPAWSPAVARRGYRLAYLRLSSARSIQQMDIAAGSRNARGLVTSVGGQNAGPQISPDGKRLVYMSDRAGGMDIWVSDRDGSNPVQVTAVGTAGTPRWSPDGKSIAFDVGLGPEWQQPRAIFVVNADGGMPRPLVQDTFNNPAPSWSRDGQWIYFASDRSGSWQVWKVPSAGGAAVPVTTQGGFAAWEGPDHYLYYAKHRLPGPELWRIPVSGGAEAPVFPRVQPVDWGAWAVSEKGIFFVATDNQGAATLFFFDFSSLTTAPVARLEQTPFWLGAAADGSDVVFDVPGNEASHIMLLENFR